MKTTEYFGFTEFFDKAIEGRKVTVTEFFGAEQSELDRRPWAAWKRHNLNATPSLRKGCDDNWPRCFSSLPILRPLLALRLNPGRALSA